MINKKCSLILHDLYEYDIKSAYATILGKQYYDFDDIDLDNKTERSIYIGKQQRGNENLSQFLMKSADSLVDFYLLDNDVSEDEIIVTQRDGFIITKLLDNDDQFIDMSLRGLIDFLIISTDRKSVLYAEDNEIHIKALSYYYDGLLCYYNQFLNFDFYNKSRLFKQMEYLKNSILTSVDVIPFLIPRDEKSYIVITYNGNIEVTDPDYINPKHIDRKRYFDHYFKDFLGSIYLTCY